MASDTSEQDKDPIAEGSAGEAPRESPQPAESYAPDQLQGKAATALETADVNLDLVLEVPVNVSLQVGTTDLPIRELVKLVEGSVIALDRESNEAMDVLVNGKLIARGEIVIVDEQFGVRLTDVVSPVERIENIS